ncbi:MAG: helix-turn-helix transcriptional regulator [Polyangiales bacterium]
MSYDPEAHEAMPKPETVGDASSETGDAQGASKPKASKKSGNKPNNVRKIRIERMMSKAELARRANLSVLTIDRVEKGFGCRMDTKRKILEALGLRLADRVRVFGEEE